MRFYMAVHQLVQVHSATYCTGNIVQPGEKLFVVVSIYTIIRHRFIKYFLSLDSLCPGVLKLYVVVLFVEYLTMIFVVKPYFS